MSAVRAAVVMPEGGVRELEMPDRALWAGGDELPVDVPEGSQAAVWLAAAGSITDRYVLRDGAWMQVATGDVSR